MYAHTYTHTHTHSMPCNQKKGDKLLSQIGWKLMGPPPKVCVCVCVRAQARLRVCVCFYKFVPGATFTRLQRGTRTHTHTHTCVQKFCYLRLVRALFRTHTHTHKQTQEPRPYEVGFVAGLRMRDLVRPPKAWEVFLEPCELENKLEKQRDPARALEALFLRLKWFVVSEDCSDF